MKKKLNEVDLSPKIKTALRVINDKLGIQRDSRKSPRDDFEMTGVMMNYINDLSPDERKVLIDVIKSITLLTSGNVNSVRTAGRSYDSEMAEPWSKILSPISSEILRYMKFDTDKVITERDYQVASKILSSLSGKRNLVAEPMKKYTKIYRGMKNLSRNTIAYLLTTNRFIIDQESSFSVDLKASWKFATGYQYTTLYVIDNPEMKGLDARNLSDFPHEKEVIFSGAIRIDKVTINNNRSNKKDPADISQADFVLDPKESYFDEGLKAEILDALPEKEDTFTMNMGINLSNGKKLYRPMFIIHGTVE